MTNIQWPSSFEEIKDNHIIYNRFHVVIPHEISLEDFYNYWKSKNPEPVAKNRCFILVCSDKIIETLSEQVKKLMRIELQAAIIDIIKDKDLS